jgi:hypothetical protein
MTNEKKPTLHAIREKRDEWQCTACNTTFSGNKMKVVNLFGAHVRGRHKPAPKPEEDLDPAEFRAVWGNK